MNGESPTNSCTGAVTMHIRNNLHYRVDINDIILVAVKLIIILIK